MTVDSRYRHTQLFLDRQGNIVRNRHQHRQRRIIYAVSAFHQLCITRLPSLRGRAIHRLKCFYVLKTIAATIPISTATVFYINMSAFKRNSIPASAQNRCDRHHRRNKTNVANSPRHRLDNTSSGSGSRFISAGAELSHSLRRDITETSQRHSGDIICK